jgi:DnaK suppressor protein
VGYQGAQIEGDLIMSEVKKVLIEDCKKLLLGAKEDILNRVADTKHHLNTSNEKGGDEGDQTVRALAENEMLGMHNRLRSRLMEVEYALARIEAGNFGFCEETEELIEEDRLRAIPWTRLSIEGAEIRESLKKRFAHF